MDRPELRKTPESRKQYLVWLSFERYEDLPQKDRTLKYIAEHGSITPMEAIDLLGIMRLGARIFELIEDSWPIISEPVTGKNRYGDDTRYASYKMAA